MQTPTYRLADYLTRGQAFFVGWTRRVHAQDPVLHCHDFCECFWIQRGSCVHRIADTEERLTAGALRFVRAPHVHGFVDGTADLELVNIALPTAAVAGWAAQYPDLRGRYFWSDSAVPEGVQLGLERVALLSEQALMLSLQTGQLMALHRFLLELLCDLTAGQEGEVIPVWLRHGLHALTEPEVFAGGVAAFARACHRSQAHVSRSCKRYLGKTASELVNAVRLDYAARRLRLTEDGVLQIILDSGVVNPSHFYKLFRARFGLTPRQYRSARWT